MVKCNEHQNLTPTELALLTWYDKDNPLYKDRKHPTLGLGGEIGEVVECFKKNTYKPNYNWWRCECGHAHTFEHCNYEEIDIDNRAIYSCLCKKLTPIILQELADCSYYLRILAWIQNKPLERVVVSSDVEHCIYQMYRTAAKLFENEGDISKELNEIYSNLCSILESFGYGWDDIIELNYIKLNSEESHHGWRK